MMLDMKDANGWRPPVVPATATGGTGLEELVSEIHRHQEYLKSSDLLKEKNREGYRAVLEEYLRLLTVTRVLDSAEEDGSLDAALQDLLDGRFGPMEVAKRLLDR
jgi:putative protein kinase ArgK-like GTPase of G3E family